MLGEKRGQKGTGWSLFSGRKVNRLAGIWKRLAQRKGRGVPICSVVIPAAGSSSRMEGIDKILTTLGDLPVLVHTLRVFEDCPDIAEVVVVTREDLLVEVSRKKNEDLSKTFQTLEQIWEEYGVYQKAQDDQV